ncbi:MAG: glycine--tRNA ligase [Patescibacteria group bacterium]
MTENLMQKVVSLCKRRGFVYPGSEIYGGLANTWDFGPYGTLLRRNIKDLWWRKFVTEADNIYPIDGGILLSPKVWEASGHVENFTDPLVECKSCHSRFRVDQLPNLNHTYLEAVQDEFANIGEQVLKHMKSKVELQGNYVSALADLKQSPVNSGEEQKLSLITDGLWNKSNEISKEIKRDQKLIDSIVDEYYKSVRLHGFMVQVYLNKHLACPKCESRNQWDEPKLFNGMFRTFVGATEVSDSVAYLRPETAQAIFINFKNVIDTYRPKLPFGIAQVGKSFRNEITAGNFIFRDLEFEQMELEFFVRTENWENSYNFWLSQMHDFARLLGLSEKNIHEREHSPEERAHYSKKTIDLEYDFPFGRKELWGLAYRTDYDLRNHSEKSGVDLSYTDENGDKFYPHVIEPSMGVDRSMMAVLSQAYTEDKDRVVMKFPANIAPVKAAIFPLVSNKPELVEKARKIYSELKKSFMIVWDDRGNIGKRYYAQDEIGTPWCITIDYQTLEDDTVTIRHRDTTLQERVKVATLEAWIKNSLA